MTCCFPTLWQRFSASQWPVVSLQPDYINSSRVDVVFIVVLLLLLLLYRCLLYSNQYYPTSINLPTSTSVSISSTTSSAPISYVHMKPAALTLRVVVNIWLQLTVSVLMCVSMKTLFVQGTGSCDSGWRRPQVSQERLMWERCWFRTQREMSWGSKTEKLMTTFVCLYQGRTTGKKQNTNQVLELIHSFMFKLNLCCCFCRRSWKANTEQESLSCSWAAQVIYSGGKCKTQDERLLDASSETYSTHSWCKMSSWVTVRQLF